MIVLKGLQGIGRLNQDVCFLHFLVTYFSHLYVNSRTRIFVLIGKMVDAGVASIKRNSYGSRQSNERSFSGMGSWHDGKHYQEVEIHYNGIVIIREPTDEKMEEYFQSTSAKSPS